MKVLEALGLDIQYLCWCKCHSSLNHVRFWKVYRKQGKEQDWCSGLFHTWQHLACNCRDPWLLAYLMECVFSGVGLWCREEGKWREGNRWCLMGGEACHRPVQGLVWSVCSQWIIATNVDEQKKISKFGKRLKGMNFTEWKYCSPMRAEMINELIIRHLSMFVACSMQILWLLLIVEIIKQFESHLEDNFRHFIGYIKKLKMDYLWLKIITSCSSYFPLQDLKSSSESQLIKPSEIQCCHVIRGIKAHLCF